MAACQQPDLSPQSVTALQVQAAAGGKLRDYLACRFMLLKGAIRRAACHVYTSRCRRPLERHLLHVSCFSNAHVVQPSFLSDFHHVSCSC